MGQWKRRIFERVRQDYGITTERGFKPTSNARLQATFSETKRLADALRKYDKQCTAHIKSVKDFSKQTQGFLGMTVPRMHRESKPGEAIPAEAESIVGVNVDFDKIAASAVDGEERIYRYVQEPLRKWLANFDTVVIALQTVDQLRLTLDSRRRTIATLEGEMTKLQTKITSAEDPRFVRLVDKKHRQEVKLAQVQDDFQRKEMTTYQNMRHLVNDVRYVQQHIHKLFDLLRQINGDVCDAFPLNSPLPADMASSYAAGDTGYGYTASDQQYPDATGPDPRGATAPVDSQADEYSNQIDGHMYGGHTTGKLADRYADRHIAGAQAGYNPV